LQTAYFTDCENRNHTTIEPAQQTEYSSGMTKVWR